MTPEERAEKILERLAPEPGYPWANLCKNFVAAEITDAIATEYAKGALDQQKKCKDHVRAAIEKAANTEASMFRHLYDGENGLAKRIHVAVGRGIRALKIGEKHSCKGQGNQVFCNDPLCGNRNSNGGHKIGDGK